MTVDNLSKWRVESLRLTIFPTTIPDVTRINWWETLIGEAPETKTLQARIGTLQEVGPIRNGLCNFSLDYQPQRIDWQLSPILKDSKELTDFPTFASFPEAISLFKEILLPWLSQCPESNRLAFGAVLIQPVTNKGAGYELLKSYLPSVQLDSENSSDFSYQINRPRLSTSDVAELKINRLSRWSVVRLSGMLVQITAGQQMSAQVFESTQGLETCRLELDINTVPQPQKTLPQEKLRSIVEELVTLGSEIAAKGDIK